MRQRLELINTGSELLLGFNLNSHLSYIGRKLAELGLRLDRQTTVGDDRAEMRAVLAEAFQRSEILLITGGLGPTSDDFTRDIVAELLARPLQRDETVAEVIATRLRKRGLQLADSFFVQALVPAGARVLPNAHGTAPGLVIDHAGKLVVLLPGPPRELQPMFTEQVLPLLRPFAADLVCCTLKTVCLPESLVEAKVAPTLAGLAALEIGYCARPGEVEVRVVADRQTAAVAEQRIRTALGDAIIGDAEARLEAVVVQSLAAAHRTIATAESCTGGLIANRLTSVSGSSDVFLNGWVTYSNAAKQRDLGVRQETLEKFGAVSEQVAREMAEGARQHSGADYALSATGIAGPTGGTAEKPVGLVFIGFATPERTTAYRHLVQFERETFKAFVAQLALDLVRRELLP